MEFVYRVVHAEEDCIMTFYRKDLVEFDKIISTKDDVKQISIIINDTESIVFSQEGDEVVITMPSIPYFGELRMVGSVVTEFRLVGNIANNVYCEDESW